MPIDDFGRSHRQRVHGNWVAVIDIELDSRHKPTLGGIDL
jgi:hypothetical protein